MPKAHAYPLARAAHLFGKTGFSFSTLPQLHFIFLNEAFGRTELTAMSLFSSLGATRTS
jgi:hypothetical protein